LSADLLAEHSVFGKSLALVVARDGRLPAGADDTVAEAGGAVLVAGTASATVAESLPSASHVWLAETSTGPAGLAESLAPLLSPVELVLLPASPDGRDLAPRLAVSMGRPLLAGAVRASLGGNGEISADLLRLDGRVTVEVRCGEPAVVTLAPGVRTASPRAHPPAVERIQVSGGLAARAGGQAADPEVVALVEPDPATMDLADATRVIGGGAGLVPRGAGDKEAEAVFGLLTEVAATIGASVGATRVVTDAGWMGYQRQIGTTGVGIRPDLYVAFGVSGATQHVAGIGNPRDTVSVNTDASCPMTSIADLGLVTDALGLLVEIAERLDVPVPILVRDAVISSEEPS
jgi:electron transfer flavoprotein alpha subunit